MNYFYMMVGLPGSGKTTYAKELCDTRNSLMGKCAIVSTDEIRKELFEDESVQSDPDRVFKLARNRIVRHLDAGYDVIFDATNISSKRRISFLSDLKNRANDHFSPVAVIMCTDFDECCYRNSERDRKVPQEVLDRMLRNFQCPQYYEGFDKIIFANLKRQVLELSPMEFAKLSMKDFDQKNPHHKHDLLTHCKKVAEQFYQVDDERAVAGLLHDFGKMFTQKIDDDGIAHYYGHESVGTYRLMCLAGHLPIFWNSPNVFLLTNVLFYVNNHMHIRDIIKSEKAIKKYKTLWGEDRFNKLVEFMEADNKASGREV